MCFTKVRQQGRKTGLHTCSQHTHSRAKLPLLHNTATTFPETGVKFNKVGSFRSNLTLFKNRLPFALSNVKRYMHASLPRVNMDWNFRIVDVWHRLNPDLPFNGIVGKNIVLATVPCWHFSLRPVTWHASKCTRGHGSDSSPLIGCLVEARPKTSYVIRVTGVMNYL